MTDQNNNPYSRPEDATAPGFEAGPYGEGFDTASEGDAAAEQVAAGDFPSNQPEGHPSEGHQPDRATHSEEKLSPEKLGEAALKFAQETAYAAAGLADVIAAKAKEFYEQQRTQITDKTPEGVDPNFRQFVDGMPDQFKSFMDEATRAYHDMASRGRVAVTDFQSQVQAARAEREARPGADAAFDLKEGAEADADEAVVVSGEAVGEVPATDASFGADGAQASSDAQAYPGESQDEERPAQG